jgi:DNA-binding NtrC family response regulator
MVKVLIVENSARDSKRFKNLLEREGVEVEVCVSGEAADRILTSSSFAAAIILWDMPGPVTGADLLIKCQRLYPNMPVVVTSESLDASMATRAYAFGARDFLEKPFDSERIRSSLRSLLSEKDPLSPLVLELQERILGESPAIMNTLKQVARVVSHPESTVLLVGESGTGKELFARAIHELGPKNKEPWVAVNITGIPETLIESALFGHEKGAFTGATNRHVGFFEEAREGTIFLDEIGELELSLQTKLLRVVQEKKFRRLGGSDDLDFKARLVCATNRDLAAAVSQGAFRRDLFHRIAEVMVDVPPLRKRNGDIDLLLNHFLQAYKGLRHVTFARETLAILRSYPFWGNVRELENFVTSALIESEGDAILPHHLPLKSMGTLLAAGSHNHNQEVASQERKQARPHQQLMDELTRSLPDNWSEISYRDAAQHFTSAFDRIYFQGKLERWHHNITQAARDSGVDSKTFRKRWRDAGLPPLASDGEEHND